MILARFPPDKGKSTVVVSNRGSHEDLPREQKGLTRGTSSSSVMNHVDVVFPRDEGKPTLGCGYRRGDVDNLLEHSLAQGAACNSVIFDVEPVRTSNTEVPDPLL